MATTTPTPSTVARHICIGHVEEPILVIADSTGGLHLFISAERRYWWDFTPPKGVTFELPSGAVWNRNRRQWDFPDGGYWRPDWWWCREHEAGCYRPMTAEQRRWAVVEA